MYLDFTVNPAAVVTVHRENCRLWIWRHVEAVADKDQHAVSSLKSDFHDVLSVFSKKL